ncbi:hypothetical protein RCL1_004304 [Eukaryota sp. TZLM3-RCL]
MFIDAYFDEFNNDSDHRLALVNAFKEFLDTTCKPQPLLTIPDSVYTLVSSSFSPKNTSLGHPYLLQPKEYVGALRAACNSFSHAPYLISFILPPPPFPPSPLLQDLLVFDVRLLCFTRITVPPRCDSSFALKGTAGFLLKVELLTSPQLPQTNRSDSFDSFQEDKLIQHLPFNFLILITEATAVNFDPLSHSIFRISGVLKSMAVANSKKSNSKKDSSKAKIPQKHIETDYVEAYSIHPLTVELLNPPLLSQNTGDLLLANLSKTFSPSFFEHESIKQFFLLTVLMSNIDGITIRPNVLLVGESRCGKSILMKGLASLPKFVYVSHKIKVKELLQLYQEQSMVGGFLLIDGFDKMSSSLHSFIQSFLISQSVGIIMTSIPNSKLTPFTQHFDLICELSVITSGVKDSRTFARHVTNPFKKSKVLPGTLNFFSPQIFTPRREHTGALTSRTPSPFVSRCNTPVVSQSFQNFPPNFGSVTPDIPQQTQNDDEDEEIFPDEAVNRTVVLQLAALCSVEKSFTFPQETISRLDIVFPKLMDLLLTLDTFGGIFDGSIKVRGMLLGLSACYSKLDHIASSEIEAIVTENHINSAFNLMRDCLFSSSKKDSAGVVPLLKRATPVAKLGKTKMLRTVMERLSRLAAMKSPYFKENEILNLINQLGGSTESKALLSQLNESGVLVKKVIDGSPVYQFIE